MTNHRTERLRVAAPTLEPDPVFLGVLAELGASSQPAAPRTARTAGLRMVVATASVAVIAAATWAAGVPNGEDIPLSPADAPTHQEPSRQPSHGDVGTPQPDVSTHSPGSPLSPGLPGASSSGSEHASERGLERGRGFESPTGTAPGRSGDTPRSTQGEENGKNGERGGRPGDVPSDVPGDAPDDRPGDGRPEDDDSSDERRPSDLLTTETAPKDGGRDEQDGPRGGRGPEKVKKTR